MITFDWGNIAVNAVLIAIVAHFIKKWMTDTEKTVKSTASALSAVTAQHSKEIAAVTEKNREEVKETARFLSENTKETSKMMIHSIDMLTAQVREANGRTTKNEVAIAEQKGRFEERARIEDHKDHE